MQLTRALSIDFPKLFAPVRRRRRGPVGQFPAVSSNDARPPISRLLEPDCRKMV